MKRIISVGIGIVLVVVLLVVGMPLYRNYQINQFLNRHGLSQMTLPEMLAQLEDRLDTESSFNARITGHQLLMADREMQVEIAVPDNMFYLSVAPYITHTHPCAIHNLVTCRGELANQSFMVSVTDLATNEIVFEGQVRAAINGFFGIWLPANIEAIISVSFDGKEASTLISTDKEADTCLTTLRLE